ncbi:hypothetical protein TRVL_08397 [Trypanosoma vivax]|nr:hypothetical protein TRVL_08397 [Trypanosoma vivax]
MCYGVASWWFEASLSDRERLERVQAQASHIGREYSQSSQSGGYPARGAAEADKRGGTSESVGILPVIEGQRSSARESGGQRLHARAPNPRQACEGRALVQHH